MGWLILFSGVICSALLTNIFKGFDKFHITTSVAIVFNYLTASTLSFFFAKSLPDLTEFVQKPWALAAVILGFLFVTLFNLMAVISQKIGIAQANVANKTTFIFPAIMGIVFFHESLDLVKFLGFVLAFIAVWFTAKEKGEKAMSKHSNFLLILVLFLGGGMIDIVLSIADKSLLEEGETPLFTAYSFGTAGILGLINLSVQLFRKKISVQKKDVVGGLCLGIPNFFSIYFFMSALAYPGMVSSVVFTVANLAIIVVATLMGSLFFKENISQNKLISIGLACVSILMVSLGS